MKKYILLCLITVLLTGCSTTVNIYINEDNITENVELVADNQIEYDEMLNWNGFPLTLYYDQKLTNPFSKSNEKESGVPYYDTTFLETERKVKINGRFNFDNHERSSIIKNCFKYYEVRKYGNNYIFSTSSGLTCAYSDFKVVVQTPYKVVLHNAPVVDEINNTYVWNVTNDNKNDINLYFEIDTSRYNDDKLINDSEKQGKEKLTNKLSSTLIIVISVIFIIGTLIFALILKKKKDSLDI